MRTEYQLSSRPISPRGSRTGTRIRDRRSCVVSVLPNVLVMRCLLGTAGRVPALDIQTPTELHL